MLTFLIKGPIVLDPGTTYILVSQELENGDLWYDQKSITLTSDATPLSVAWAKNGRTEYNLSPPGPLSIGLVNLIYKVLAATSPYFYTLTVTKTGTGSGTVTGSSATINCGPTCSVSLNSGTLVGLNAVPATGSIFAGWSGDCAPGINEDNCFVELSANKAVTATFNNFPGRLITFDDLPPLSASDIFSSVPSSYAGLNWENFDYISKTRLATIGGYDKAITSPPNAALGGG